MDSSRREMIATSNSVGAESDNSAAALLLEQHQHQQHVDETKTATDNSDRNNNSTTTKSDSKPFQKKNSSENLEPNKKRTAPYPNTGVFDASILMYDNENELEESDVADDVQKPLKNGAGGGAKIAAANNNNTKTNNNKLKNTKPDTTTRGGISTTFNQQIADDSLSTLSDKKKKVIVRIVTVFSVIFFLICFAMIAFTLRMSEKIDAQIRKGYSGSNFNSITTKGSNVSLSPSSIGSNSDMLAKMSTMSSSNSRSQPRTTRFVNARKRRSLFEEIYSSRIKRIINRSIDGKSVKKAATNYSKNYSNKANKHR